jgi:hypothetical protein
LQKFLRRPASFVGFEFLEHESMRLLGSASGATELPPFLPAKESAPQIAKRTMSQPKTRSKNASTAFLVDSEPRLHRESTTVDTSPMVTACYEAYLDMRKLLAVLAELRGDDAQDALW